MGQGWETVLWRRLVWARAPEANHSSHQLRQDKWRADVSSSSPLDALSITLASVTTRVSLGFPQSLNSFSLHHPPLVFVTLHCLQGLEIGYIVPLPQDTVPAGYTWHTCLYPPCSLPQKPQRSSASSAGSGAAQRMQNSWLAHASSQMPPSYFP